MTAPLPPSRGRDVAGWVIAATAISLLVAALLAGNTITF